MLCEDPSVIAPDTFRCHPRAKRRILGATLSRMGVKRGDDNPSGALHHLPLHKGGFFTSCKVNNEDREHKISSVLLSVGNVFAKLSLRVRLVSFSLFYAKIKPPAVSVAFYHIKGYSICQTLRDEES